MMLCGGATAERRIGGARHRPGGIRWGRVASKSYQPVGIRWRPL